MGIKLSDIKDGRLRDRIQMLSEPVMPRGPVLTLPDRTVSSLKIAIAGQVRGGKNNMIVTRTGHRFPRKSWATWRDQAVAQVVSQLPIGFTPFSTPVSMRLDYVAGDRIRRDMPAVIDSLFHVLEKSGVVTDDTLIWVSESTRSYNKEEPMASMDIWWHKSGKLKKEIKP